MAVARNKPEIAIVGAGSLASALAPALKKAGNTIAGIIVRDSVASLRDGKRLAASVGAECVTVARADITAQVVWFCVPDREIARAAQSLAQANWKGRVALHASGALLSNELAVLHKRGASVASAHPLMTFVRGSRPSLVGVPFAIEGDAVAMRTAYAIVLALRGKPWTIRAADKAAYHAWGTFASPLLIALLATTEGVAKAAGVNQKTAREKMLPILAQTLANYATLGASEAFSGPLVRGDVETVRVHLRTLRRVPAARATYLALAHAATECLPAKNRREMRRLLKD
jgi:predicted short-subunit dehydrogenase-like oxidoreductase (DUF2520 family)